MLCIFLGIIDPSSYFFYKTLRKNFANTCLGMDYGLMQNYVSDFPDNDHSCTHSGVVAAVSIAVIGQVNSSVENSIAEFHYLSISPAVPSPEIDQ
jgi:hypothetical protein